MLLSKLIIVHVGWIFKPSAAPINNFFDLISKRYQNSFKMSSLNNSLIRLWSNIVVLYTLI